MENKYSKLIDNHNLISDISYKLRTGSLTLKKIENSTLISLESFVQKIDAIGESMDKVIEDNILHANEVEIVQTGLDELSGIMESLNETHQQNKGVINSIIKIVHQTEKLFRRIQYLEDIQRGLSHTYSGRKKYAYYLDSAARFDILSKIMKIFDEKLTSPELSKVEIAFIDLLLPLGYLETFCNDDVLYANPLEIQNDIKEAVQKLNESLYPITYMIRQRYFQPKLKKAKKGFLHLLENKDFQSNQVLKLKGIFRSKKGFGDLEKLIDSIQLLD